VCDTLQLTGYVRKHYGADDGGLLPDSGVLAFRAVDVAAVWAPEEVAVLTAASAARWCSNRATGGVSAIVIGTRMGSKAFVQIKAMAREEPGPVIRLANQPRSSGLLSDFSAFSDNRPWSINQRTGSNLFSTAT